MTSKLHSRTIALLLKRQNLNPVPLPIKSKHKRQRKKYQYACIILLAVLSFLFVRFINDELWTTWFSGLPFLSSSSIEIMNTANSTTNSENTTILERYYYKKIPVIILKNGRSGSSWFRNLLHEEPYSSIKKELITKNLGLKLNRREKFETIFKFMKKYNDTTNSDTHIFGFTMCPFLHDGSTQDDIIDVLKEVRSHFPSLRLIVFSRSNVFRTAIASHSTKIHDIRKNVSIACHEEGKDCCATNFPFQNFQCEFPNILKYHNMILKMSNTISRDWGVPVKTYLFEDLLRDTRGTMKSVFQELGLPDNITSHLLNVKNLTSSTTNTKSIRNEITSNNNFSIDLANQSLYLNYFQSLPNPSKDCLLNQLHIPNDVVSPVCDYPFTSLENKFCGKKYNPSYECKE